MSRYFDYYGLDNLKVTNYERIKKLKDMEDINGHDLRHLLHLRPTMNVEENRIDWTADVGLKFKTNPDELETNINHFSPDDCTTQMFLNELAACVEDFEVIVKDEEFPSVNDSGYTTVYSWLLENKNGVLTITELQLIKGETLKDISFLRDIEDE